MASGNGGGQKPSSETKHVVALALIAIVPSTITAIGGFMAGGRQGPPPPAAPADTTPPSPSINNDKEEADINQVRGFITKVETRGDGITLDCEGTISNLKPKSQNLWLAVEDNGHLFFKRSDIR